MIKIKLIEKAENKVGTVFGLEKNERGTFGVWILKASYAGHVKGGVAYTWCYVIRDVDEATARDVFAKKLRGKAK